MKIRFLASLLALSIGGCGDEKIVENDVGYYQSEYDKANEDSKRFFPSEYDNHIPNLLACVTCGGNIAKNAEKCPHCGAPGLDTLNAFRLKWAKLVKDYTAKQEKEYQMKNPEFGSEEWSKQQEEKRIAEEAETKAKLLKLLYNSEDHSPMETTIDSYGVTSKRSIVEERIESGSIDSEEDLDRALKRYKKLKNLIKGDQFSRIDLLRLFDYYVYLYREKNKTRKIPKDPYLGFFYEDDALREELDSFAKTLDPIRKLCADHYLNGRHEEAAELDETGKYPWVEVD